MPKHLLSLCCLLALVGLFAGQAAAECSLDVLETCSADETALLEQRLKDELKEDRSQINMLALGRFYRTAIEPFRDPAQAIAYLEQAADGGEPWAMLVLGEMLGKGEGVAADLKGAEDLLIQTADAGLKGPALLARGNLRREAGDHRQAMTFFEQAAEAGEPWAMLALADMLGKGGGTTADPKRAEKLLRRAAEAGLEGPALLALGNLHRGAGDHGQAVAHFEQAAEAGEPWAMLALADMLEKGKGTAADPERADALRYRALNEHRLEYAYVELIFSAVQDYTRPALVRKALSLLKSAHEADPDLGKNAFMWLHPNQKAAVVQDILGLEDIYNGRLNGMLTRATLRAIGVFCRRHAVDECRKEAMPPALLEALLVYLADRDLPA